MIKKRGHEIERAQWELYDSIWKEEREWEKWCSYNSEEENVNGIFYTDREEISQNSQESWK